MDKQKQIEEMAKVLESKHLSMCTWDSYNDDFNDNYPNECKKVATALYKAGYRKIPESAVVLTDKKDIQRFEWSKMCDKMGIFKLVDKTRKETAEKFAERLNREDCSIPIKDDFIIVTRKSVDEICKELIGE